MSRCTFFYPSNGERCQEEATLVLIDESGKDVPGGRMCEEHSKVVLDEYLEKLEVQWKTREMGEKRR